MWKCGRDVSGGVGGDAFVFGSSDRASSFCCFRYSHTHSHTHACTLEQPSALGNHTSITISYLPHFLSPVEPFNNLSTCPIYTSFLIPSHPFLSHYVTILPQNLSVSWPATVRLFCIVARVAFIVAVVIVLLQSLSAPWYALVLMC